MLENAIHQGADGRTYLVVHGDHFDLVVTQARWLALLGDSAYDAAIFLNCGDWVESCTAVAEHHDGRMEIIRWVMETPEIEIPHLSEIRAA